ncbi:AhpD-like protein [Glarea lozoyensis ATCC 20868]|uniref:AhpD-like protein n=1 Tax=Glarea lozoyensis (strain ATCC 20868 / MF5171) TaxID=1116229 RepID=S3DE81_GLAL2|nr:AhpD-like protein [Glarea lozoyensis ATCC 20868]EPE36065.1 AhpD-like protein [Glarea lozoyensis ATCC 20868]
MDFLKRKKNKDKNTTEENQALNSGDLEIYRAGAFEGDPPTGSFYAPQPATSAYAGETLVQRAVNAPPAPKQKKKMSKQKGAKMGGAKEEIDIAENNMDDPAHQTIYGRGYDMRKRVVGEEYVAKALEAGSSDFLRPLQQYATEAAWGTIWTRPGLELKTRSLLNLVMLTALSKWTELGTHVRGAVRNGASEVEIRETLLQASAYCGMPAGMEAFRVADRVLNEMEEKGEFIRDRD